MGEYVPAAVEHHPPSRSARSIRREVIDARLIDEEGPEPGEYWTILKKRRRIVLWFLLATLVPVLAFGLLSTPIYQAETVLLIEPTDPEVLDIPHVVGGSLEWGEDYYNTQHEILRSHSLAARVVRDLRLDAEPAFSDDTGLLAETVDAVVGWLPSWIGPVEDEVLDGEGVEPRLAELYLEDLTVVPVRSSRLVRIHFESPDPQLAARVANAHAAAYIDQGLDFRKRASREARAFLEEKLVELRARVEESEAALNAYRRNHGIVSLDDKSNVVIERLADLNHHVTQAEAERIALEADATLIRNRQAEWLPAVIESELVRTLKGQLVDLEGQHASLARRFKPGYPRRAQLEAQIRETRTRLSREIQSIVEGIESAYLAAAANERELRRQLQKQKDEALRLKDASVEYAILEHDAETSSQLYDSVRQRIKETGIGAELRASNVFVIDPAHPPLDPIRPDTGRNLALGLLLGLMGGMGCAFLAEYLDHRLRGAEEVERLLRLPNLGAVPQSPQLAASSSRRLAVGRKREGKRSQLQERGPGFFDVPLPVTEAYRSIRTRILLSQAGEPPRTILFSSSGEGEGKTTTLLHTAAMFARLGSPVLVIDADLRRPSCHRILGVDNRTGLTEVLTGQPSRMQRVQIGDAPFFFLGSGGTPPNPTELLGSPRMKEVLARLGERFDHILIDAPPLMPVSDAVVLSTLVDGVVLVIDQQSAPRQIVKQARMRLGYARAKILGFVLNRADASAVEYVESRREVA